MAVTRPVNRRRRRGYGVSDVSWPAQSRRPAAVYLRYGSRDGPDNGPPGLRWQGGSVAVPVAAASTARARDEGRAWGVPWYVAAVLVAATRAVVGVIWDISWHRTIGRDTFWTPAHLAIYLAGALAGAACGWLVLKTTFAGTPEQRAAGVSFWGFRGPLGAWVCIWGAIAMIASAPFDNWWHNAYGLDVKIISPPHTLLALGFVGIELGALLMVVALQNRAAGEAGATGTGRAFQLLYAYAAGIILLNGVTMGMEYVGFPNHAHNALYYKIAAVGGPFSLAAFGRASRLRWPATAAAAVYMGVTLLMIWVLQHPDHQECNAHVDGGRGGGGPAEPRCPTERGEGEGPADGGDLVVERVVRVVREADVLHPHRHPVEEDDPRCVGIQQLEGAARPRRSRFACGAVLQRHYHQQGAELDADEAEGEQRVRRADDLDVQPIGVVPPIVERGGGDHRDRAPDADPGAEGSAEPPE